jgi:hypothetical protein
VRKTSLKQLASGLFLLGLGLSMVWTSLAWAGEHCRCAHCGHQQPCTKICRLVPDEKKVTITCWAVEKEDFALPGGPSERGCKHCEEVCADCEKESCSHHTAAKTHTWYDWIPNCSAKVFTKNKLMKKTVTKKVPGYKWVVEDVCAHCETGCKSVEVAPGTPIPAPPADAVKK